MVFQQRNRRVDRYGQKYKPQIIYLFTDTLNERIRGDWRILEILERKDEQAAFNLGDPSAFLNVYQRLSPRQGNRESQRLHGGGSDT